MENYPTNNFLLYFALDFKAAHFFIVDFNFN